MKRILIAGGLCGTTMLMAAQKLEKRCSSAKIPVEVTVHNLWEGGAIAGKGFHVIIEMFPFFEDTGCPVLCGKPFISHAGERELIEQVVALLEVTV